MANTEKQASKKGYWLQSIFWLVICILFLIFLPEWFWVTLPFMLTAMVYAAGRI